MAITVTNTARVWTPQNSAIVGNKVTISCFMRINSVKSTTSAQYVYGRLYSHIYASGTSLDKPDILVAGRAASTAVKTRLTTGSVYHVALIYDKDDPTRQFLSVNGVHVPYPLPNSSPLPLNADSYIGGGTYYPSDFTVQDLLFLDGYAMTDRDMKSIMDNPASTATFGATMPNVIRAYYSLEGPEGAAVHAGDPGMTVPGQPKLSFQEPILGVNDSIKYAPRMNFMLETAVEQAYVRTSGKTLTVSFKNARTGARTVVGANTLVATPTIKVNGGSPVQLPGPDAGTYIADDCQAILFPLPGGLKISPTDSVVINAPDGWVSSDYGICPALVDLPVSNRSGRPSSMEAWPEEDPLRVGVNIGAPVATYWSAICMNKNRAIDMNLTGYPTWPDGTCATNWNSDYMAHASGNGVDLVGYNYKEGLFVVGWDDYDRTDPVTIMLTPPHNDAFKVVERMEFRNNGDAQGKGKVRAFEVSYQVRNFTLKVPIDAAATSIDVNETADQLASSNSEKVTYLTVDGEQILVGSFDFTNRRFLNCVRGWNGTRAASHAAAAPAVVRYSNKCGALRLTVNSPSSKPHYARFKVYTPGEWDVPTPPAPVVLPDLPWDALDSDFESYFEEGSGVLRCMDSTPVFTSTSEVEHCSAPGDPHWNGAKWTDKWVYKAAQPYDPAVSPYVYAPVGGFNTEKYPATLGAPIATAPAPGTIETITITDGRTAPILYGQQLFAGDEIMRVVEIPKLSGTQYKVERGSVGTPTSTHPAGPIQVGHRIRVTSNTQWLIDRKHSCEIIIDEAASTPLRWGPNMGTMNGMVDDGSPLARRSLTLPDGVDASATTFKVVPAATGDWDYLGANLPLYVESERMVIRSVDRTAGTITVNARSGAAAHPAGVVGQTKYSGILFQNPDGTGKVWNHPFFYSGAMIPTGIDRYLSIIDMDGQYGYLGQHAAGYQPLDPTRVKTIEYTLPKFTIPYELGPRVAAKSKECWYWLNIPYLASDALMYHIAKVTRDNLPPGRKVYVELSNEVWNQYFYQYAHGIALSPMTGSAPGAWTDYFVLRSKVAADIVRRVFAEKGRESEVVFVMAWQLGFIGQLLETCRRLGVDPDAASVAPYLNPPSTPEFVRCYNAFDDEQYCDLYTHYVEFGTNGLSFRANSDQMIAQVDQHQKLTGKKLSIVYYEGGDGTTVPYTPAGSPVMAVDSWARSRDVRYNPRWWDVQRDVNSIFRRIGKCETFAIYMLGAAITGQAPYTWNLVGGKWKKAGRGDGRNGGVDNRKYLFRKGQPNSVDLLQSPDAVNEEVRLQAFKDHNSDFFAKNPGGPVDPTDPTDPGGPLNPVVQKALKFLPLSPRVRLRTGA